MGRCDIINARSLVIDVMNLEGLQTPISWGDSSRRHNFDGLAKCYRWLEYAAFGRELERSRIDVMPWLESCERVLTLGEGDGRFVEALVRRYPALEVVCVEASGRMIERAQQRLPEGARVTFLQADAGTVKLEGEFDGVVTCFFLDCFETATLHGMLPRIANHLRSGGVWGVAEFESNGWRARAWLRLMYACFRFTTNLEADRLPSWREEFRRMGLESSTTVQRQGGFIQAERWQKP